MKVEYSVCKWGKVVKTTCAAFVIMLIGEYEHTIDQKRRMALPAKFRKDLGKKVVITRGLDTCLFVYSQKQWEKAVEELSHLSKGQANSRAIGRFFLAGAVDMELDSLGRVLIPEFLAKFAGLSGVAMVIGVHERVELWNEKAWRDYKIRVEKQADEMAEKLGDIGVL